jgi:hypothetical protein
MDDELKPCPFCGSAAKPAPQDAVNCTNGHCDASVYLVSRATWNRRAAPVVTGEMVERGAIGMCSSQFGWEGLFIDEQEQHLFNSRKCLAAALESPDG